VLRIRILTSSRTRNRFVADGIEEYVKRIAPLAKLEIVGPRRRPGSRRREVLARDLEGLWVALDPAGSEITTEEFANLLSGANSTTFLIGSPAGLATELSDMCSVRLSLTRLTLTGEMTLLILVEQVYRALTILGSHPYHK
jgi:23S rRNA (pseudouridine1915-N3)-methyltransferase